MLASFATDPDNLYMAPYLGLSFAPAAIDAARCWCFFTVQLGTPRGRYAARVRPCTALLAPCMAGSWATPRRRQGTIYAFPTWPFRCGRRRPRPLTRGHARSALPCRAGDFYSWHMNTWWHDSVKWDEKNSCFFLSYPAPVQRVEDSDPMYTPGDRWDLERVVNTGWLVEYFSHAIPKASFGRAGFNGFIV
jgi:hypothetical protein